MEPENLSLLLTAACYQPYPGLEQHTSAPASSLLVHGGATALLWCSAIGWRGLACAPGSRLPGCKP
jgi:hypothetical protein